MLHGVSVDMQKKIEQRYPYTQEVMWCDVMWCELNHAVCCMQWVWTCEIKLSSVIPVHEQWYDVMWCDADTLCWNRNRFSTTDTCEGWCCSKRSDGNHIWWWLEGNRFQRGLIPRSEWWNLSQPTTTAWLLDLGEIRMRILWHATGKMNSGIYRSLPPLISEQV